MHNTFEKNPIISKQSVYNYANFLDKIIGNKIKEETKQAKISKFLSIIKIFIDAPEEFIYQVKRSHEMQLLVANLHVAYREMGIRNDETFPIQETIFPSEIIGITSEIPDNKHYTLIKKL